MTWSDAARAAALEARRQHAIGKKITPPSWFHGGPVMHGTKLRATVGEFINGKLRMSASASSSFKEARSYATAISTWAEKGLFGMKGKGVMYAVALPKARQAKLIQRTRLFPSMPAKYREATSMGPNVKRVPHAKGRASRGHY